MSKNVPVQFRYTKEHEWAEILPSGRVRVGITDHAQSALGDIVFLDLPQNNRTLKQGEALGVVESIKAVSDIYSPISGTVRAVHEDLRNSPEKLNQEPYTSWLIEIEPSQPSELEALMTPADYQNYVEKH